MINSVSIDQDITRGQPDQNFDSLQADNILSEAESLGREGLAAAVKREMREAYKEDELWSVITKERCEGGRAEGRVRG